MRNVSSVVEKRLDRAGVNDLEADHVSAKVVARINRDAVKGEVLPHELRDPLAPAAVAVDVWVLPVLEKHVDVFAVHLASDLICLRVTDVLLVHDLRNGLIGDRVGQFLA